MSHQKSSNRSKQECFMESLKSFPIDQVTIFQEEGATLRIKSNRFSLHKDVNASVPNY
jgi:hypothetical protein